MKKKIKRTKHKLIIETVYQKLTIEPNKCDGIYLHQQFNGYGYGVTINKEDLKQVIDYLTAHLNA
jgi:hypothetical protein